MLTVVHFARDANDNGSAAGRSLLDEIVRDGARQILAAALQAEVAAYVAQFADQLDENGHRMVARNGYHQPREVLTAAGAVEVTAPRVNDRRVDPDTGHRQRFSSAILPAWARKSPQMSEVLPLLYLHGPSTSDFGPALEQFLGSGAGLSATTIARLTSRSRSTSAPNPKVIAKITDDLDTLLEFCKYPAEHWIHLRTTNPIESTFATVRLRTKVTKGPGSRAAGLAMTYKLIDAAQARWRAVNAPHLIAPVRVGAVFHKGKLLERPTDITTAVPTANDADPTGSEVA
ncbi:transposase [Micromonospora sp. WMMD736]|uniref:transposase n=1 Tax=Micromonospora sp. WMMD736 TaxID=3404112 RepID=UPI003B95321A